MLQLARFPTLAFSSYHFLGEAHAAVANHAAAQGYYTRALGTGRVTDSTIYHHQGITQVALGCYAEAETSLRAALARKPQAWWSCKSLGEILLLQGRLPEAEIYFSKALATNNTDFWAHYHRFECQRASIGCEAALLNWLDGVLAAPLMSELRMETGLFWEYSCKYAPEHLEKLRRVAVRYPESHEVSFLLSCLIGHMGQVEEATAQLLQYMKAAWHRDYSQWATLSSQTHKDPEFVIIGTEKGGSSALYSYLIDHPLICPAVVKEVNYWSSNQVHGSAWYRACFMPIPAMALQITGEASIFSLWHEQAPEKMAVFRADMKLLLILRDPVQRAYSAYQMRKRLGADMPNWDVLVEQELHAHPYCPLQPEDLPAGYQGSSMMLNGAVLPFLKRWMCYFPRAQFLILQNSDLSSDTQATVNAAYTFLDLPAHTVSSTQRLNVGTYAPMAPDVERRLRDWYRPHQSALAKFLTMELA
ncbi:MAG: sulfotransferase domain-containing protein [Haliea sp.]|nr:sulfotransferase domain-containing protein [Haliea sp.]